MAESDQFTTSKWRDNGGCADLGSHDLSTLKVSDFEVVDFSAVFQAFPMDEPNDQWPDSSAVPFPTSATARRTLLTGTARFSFSRRRRHQGHGPAS